MTAEDTFPCLAPSSRYPFTAIVGQDRLKTALLANAIQPRLGGVLIRGERGTAKSTAARALADVLPPIRVVSGCSFHCDPDDPESHCASCRNHRTSGSDLHTELNPVSFVTLPLGATEERVVGSVDIARALSSGALDLRVGLLGVANRGILYVDEVNLLEDHLVNVLLDAAAMGRNIVERDGISVEHPARFVLVGTMNPEEGELRPQFMDRFGAVVDIEAEQSLESRIAILERIEAYDRDSRAFCESFSTSQAELRTRLAAAIDRAKQVRVDREAMAHAATIAIEASLHGHRAELSMVRFASALAAWHDEAQISKSRIEEAATFVLPHRKRRTAVDRHQQSKHRKPQVGGSASAGLQAQPKETTTPAMQTQDELPGNSLSALPNGSVPTVKVSLCAAVAKGSRVGSSGNNSWVERGKSLGSAPHRTADEPVDVAATLLAATTRSRAEQRDEIRVTRDDLRSSKTAGRTQRAVCFLVDASGSMGCRQRLETARDAAAQLLTQTYQSRNYVSLIVAAHGEVTVAVPLTKDSARVADAVSNIECGGNTPLAHGLSLARDELRKAEQRGLAPTLVLLTDGRANVPLAPGRDPLEDALDASSQLGEDAFDALVVDTENDFVNLGVARQIAERMGAQYVRVNEPCATDVVHWVSDRV